MPGIRGTGKRTIAKLISRLFKELGILTSDHLIEVDRTDFVANYQGQSSIKTDRLLQQAIGSTIYIKDANLLFNMDDPFGAEAIDTLFKRMEEQRGKFVVIFSGTADEMNSLMKSNSNICSYFPNIFNFEDYNARQLLAIAANIAEKNGYLLDEGALQELLGIFEIMVSTRSDDFQNGIVAKNILYTAITNQEERIFNIYEKGDVDLKTIILDDVEKIII